MKDNDLVLMNRDQRNSVYKLQEFVKDMIFKSYHSAIVQRAVGEHNKGKMWDAWLKEYDETKD